jgi:hypothetical protein
MFNIDSLFFLLNLSKQSAYENKNQHDTSTSEADVETQSCHVGSKEIRIPKTTVQNLLYKRLRLYVYRIQLQTDANNTKIPDRVREANVMLNESDYVLLKPRSHDWNAWHTCVTCGYLPRRGSSTLAQISNTPPFPPAVGGCDTC